MKVFISQPMRSNDAEKIQEDRKILQDIVRGKFKDDNVEFIDSLIEDGDKMDPVEALSKSIGYLAQADMCVFAPRALDSRGCGIEYRICCAYSIPMLIL